MKLIEVFVGSVIIVLFLGVFYDLLFLSTKNQNKEEYYKKSNALVRVLYTDFIQKTEEGFFLDEMKKNEWMENLGKIFFLKEQKMIFEKKEKAILCNYTFEYIDTNYTFLWVYEKTE